MIDCLVSCDWLYSIWIGSTSFRSLLSLTKSKIYSSTKSAGYIAIWPKDSLIYSDPICKRSYGDSLKIFEIASAAIRVFFFISDTGDSTFLSSSKLIPFVLSSDLAKIWFFTLSEIISLSSLSRFDCLQLAIWCLNWTTCYFLSCNSAYFFEG